MVAKAKLVCDRNEFQVISCSNSTSSAFGFCKVSCKAYRRKGRGNCAMKRDCTVRCFKGAKHGLSLSINSKMYVRATFINCGKSFRCRCGVFLRRIAFISIFMRARDLDATAYKEHL